MGYVVAAVLGYLLGSIPVALLVARRHGVDLFATGDGNPGAWNALEQLGGRRALPAFLGDAAQGRSSPALARAGLGGLVGRLRRRWPAAMVGHAFPLFAGFRGGKAVMTFVGGAFALSPCGRGRVPGALPGHVARRSRSSGAPAPASSPSRSSSSRRTRSGT